MTFPLNDEILPLEPRFVDARQIKQVRLRRLAGLRLRALAESAVVRRLFGSELANRLNTLAGYDAGGGLLSASEREDVVAVAEMLGQRLRDWVAIEGGVIDPAELEAALTSGSPDALVTTAARRVARWKMALPNEVSAAIEQWRWRSAPYQRPVGAKEQGVPAAEAGASTVRTLIPGLTEAVTIYEGIKAGVDLVNALADIFCGPDYEIHESRHANITLERESYLNVPWRGVDWGDNNQEFTAQYLLTVIGGAATRLEVDFRIDLSGSGFDSLRYPLDVFARTTDGSRATVAPVYTTRYRQHHRVVANQVSLLVIGVVGRVYYGGDGFMTDAGLIPWGRITTSAGSEEFGAHDSVWKYGLSI